MIFPDNINIRDIWRYSYWKRVTRKVAKILIKADKVGDDMHLSFVNDCLMKRIADFFEPVNKVNLDIGSKERKNILKAVSVMKADRQAFRVTLGGRSEH